MRMKNSKTSISNLNPVFTIPLKEFDELHIKLTGNQAIVTSVDTGSHWGLIKKEDRPLGWQGFTEAQVRELSDSKHFNIPCDALDFRRRCPDGELTYYDDLTSLEQGYFVTEMYKCFPDELFDITFSRLCLHVEWDPKLKTIPLENDENRTDDDLDPREPEATSPTKGKKEVTWLPKLKTGDRGFSWFLDLFIVPPWKRDGFKRGLGTIITTAGTVLAFLPEYSHIGQAIMAIGAALGIGGSVHGAVKNKKSDDKTQIIKMVLLWLVEFVMKLITRKNKEK